MPVPNDPKPLRDGWVAADYAVELTRRLKETQKPWHINVMCEMFALAIKDTKERR